MSYLRKIVALTFVLLWIVACSDGESGEDVVVRLDENGVAFSPTGMAGYIEYMPSMKAERVRVVQVDRNLNPIDSFEVAVGSERWSSSGFSVGVRDYETPYVKLVTIFPLDKNEKMEFPQYYKLDDYNSNIYLQFYGALISGRVETLVRKEKCSLSDAIKKAYDEFEKSTGLSLDNPQSRSFYEGSSYYSASTGLYDLTPYVLCRHEISDSLFYSDFKELRDSFAKDGKFDSAIKVRAADSWLATFSLPFGPMNEYYFESTNRDTSSRLKNIDTAFFAWAYELDRPWSKKDSIEIKNELSLYNGRMFFYETNCSVFYGWRLQTALEDTIGTCLCGDREFTEHDGTAYLCRYQSSMGWEVLSDIDTILNNKYSTCGRGIGGYGNIGYYNDKMYVCDCDESNQCAWSEVKEDFKGTVLDTPTVNILASRLYGDCRDHQNEKYVMDDTVLVRCHWNMWLKVDTLSYYMGVCDNGSNQMEYGQMPNGDYYKCRTYGGKTWEPCTYADVKGDLCNSMTSGIYKKYDDQYFYCRNEKWREVPKDSVLKPVLNEDPCDSENYGEVKEYGDESFFCTVTFASGKYLYYWIKKVE